MITKTSDGNNLSPLSPSPFSLFFFLPSFPPPLSLISDIPRLGNVPSPLTSQFHTYRNYPSFSRTQTLSILLLLYFQYQWLCIQWASMLLGNQRSRGRNHGWRAPPIALCGPGRARGLVLLLLPARSCAASSQGGEFSIVAYAKQGFDSSSQKASGETFECLQGLLDSSCAKGRFQRSCFFCQLCRACPLGSLRLLLSQRPHIPMPY